MVWSPVPKVLVIEDDPIGGRLLRAILGTEGLEVVIAADGHIGLSLIESETPDVVILDLRLPDLDGLEVLELLRRAQPSLPVIILTAFGEVKTAVKATKLGAFDYLTKPVEHEQLVFSVKRALETHVLRVEVEELRRSAGLSAGLSVANVRELRNVVKQAVLESNGLTLRRETLAALLRVTDGALASSAVEPGPLPSLRSAAQDAARDAERRLIEEALSRTRGNKSQAARLLRTDYKTLYLKMKSLGVRGTERPTEPATSRATVVQERERAR